MNSSNSKSKPFTNGSPWSDKGPQSTSSGKPPRSPTRSPTRRSPPTFVSPGKNTVSSKLFPSTSKEEKTSKRCASEAEKSPNLKRNQTRLKEGRIKSNDTKCLSTPPPDSEPSKSDCDASALSASTPVFVPSQVTLASLNYPKSTGSSSALGTGHRSGSHSPRTTTMRTRSRFPSGVELKRMLEVLLDIIDRSSKKRIVFGSPTRHSSPLNEGTVSSSTIAPADQASTRHFNRSA